MCNQINPEIKIKPQIVSHLEQIKRSGMCENSKLVEVYEHIFKNSKPTDLTAHLPAIEIAEILDKYLLSSIEIETCYIPKFMDCREFICSNAELFFFNNRIKNIDLYLKNVFNITKSINIDDLIYTQLEDNIPGCMEWLYHILKTMDLRRKVLFEIFQSLLYFDSDQNSMRFKTLGEIIRRYRISDDNCRKVPGKSHETALHETSLQETALHETSLQETSMGKEEAEIANLDSDNVNVLSDLVWNEIIFYFQDGLVDEDLIGLLQKLVENSGELILPRLKNSADILESCKSLDISRIEF